MAIIHFEAVIGFEPWGKGVGRKPHATRRFVWSCRSTLGSIDFT